MSAMAALRAKFEKINAEQAAGSGAASTKKPAKRSFDAPKKEPSPQVCGARP